MDENTFDEKTYHFISDIEQIISNVKKRSNCMKYPKTYKYDKNVIRDEVLNLIIIMKELHKLYYANYPDNHPLYGETYNTFSNHTSLSYDNPKYPIIQIEYDKSLHNDNQILKLYENDVDLIWENLVHQILKPVTSNLLLSILLSAVERAKLVPSGYPIRLDDLHRSYEDRAIYSQGTLLPNRSYYTADKIIIYVNFDKNNTYVSTRVIGTLYKLSDEKNKVKTDSIQIDSSVNYYLAQSIDLRYRDYT